MLIDDVLSLTRRLAPRGWAAVLAAHGLDLTKATAAELEAELARELGASIDRTKPGFEDFAVAGKRGVTPGSPAESLLYHALASPRVKPAGVAPGDWPTVEELETIENYVYAQRRTTVSGLLARARQAHDVRAVGVVTFAYEYRVAPDTVHRKHADLAFSRTGIARVGTAPEHFDGASRGYAARLDDDAPEDVRVLPARYGAFLAIAVDEQRAGRHVLPPNDVLTASTAAPRLVWLPVHKLFAGKECLSDVELALELETRHANTKLLRLHEHLRHLGVDTDVGAPRAEPPFVREANLVRAALDATGSARVVPIAQPLTAKAVHQGQTFSLRVPAAQGSGVGLFSSSLEIAAEGAFRPAPEYLHVRTELTADGREIDLNAATDVVAAVARGGFRAVHYEDPSCDGFVRIRARNAETRTELADAVAAYSLVTAPDFVPCVKQYDLSRWSHTLSRTLRTWLWNLPPDALCNQRHAANVRWVDAAGAAVFAATDTTVTCVVGTAEPAPAGADPAFAGKGLATHSALADNAAGVFAPGWDVSLDRTNGVPHLAAYGLGSPFPEDAKLCAAISSFWPAAAPDIARKFTPNGIWPTIAPLTDTELFGDAAFDGITEGPTRSAPNRVRFPSFDHADYTRQALDGKFRIDGIGAIDLEEYTARILAMARAYHGAQGALGRIDLLAPGPVTAQSRGRMTSNKGSFVVLSFTRESGATAEDAAEIGAAGLAAPAGPHYRIEMVRWSAPIDVGPLQTVPVDPASRRIVYAPRHATEAAGLTLLVREANRWQARPSAF